MEAQLIVYRHFREMCISLSPCNEKVKGFLNHHLIIIN